MQWQAQWIWDADDPTPRHAVLCARRVVHLHRSPASAQLHITADSRYVLYLNGQRLGRGPVRAFPTNQRYDSYDVTARLRRGSNVIAVLVRHYGDANFQYIHGRGGLLCQLDIRYNGTNGETIASNATWRVRRHPAYANDTVRASIQQDYEEHFDATADMPGWTESDFDDSGWPAATVIGPAHTAPWTCLSPRDIPFLTEEPVSPVRVSRMQVVRPPALVSAVDYRPTLLDGARDANRYDVDGLLVTVLHSEKAQTVTLRANWGCGFPVRVNGHDVPVAQGDATIALAAGPNLLMVDLAGRWHLTLCMIAIDAPEGEALSLQSPTGDGSTWATVGPFRAGDAPHKARLWQAESMAALEPHASGMNAVLPEYISHAPVWLQTATQKPVGNQVPRVEAPQALCAVSDDVTTVYPADDGDVELLLDFGRELVGLLDFEVEAPAGALLDFNLFEAVEDGRIHYTEHLNNALRYRTRAGWQRYTAIARRGFRHALLTIRQLTAPLRIRRVQCLLNTYPLVEQGEFRCSDALLNQIWQVARYTVRLCAEDTFVDCPAYEQTFWLGDARNSALTTYAVYGDYALARRGWRLAAESLARSPLVESQVPSGWQELVPAFALLWVIACQEHYVYTGDDAFIRAVYPAIRQQMETIRNHYINDRGLFEIEGWNFLDWAPVDTPWQGVATHQNAWLVEAARRAALLADLMGQPDEAQVWRALAANVTEAINLHLWSETAQAYVDSLHTDGQPSAVISQQTNTLVYRCDAATPERAAIIARYVRQVRKEWVRVGSPYLLFFTAEALAKTGDFARILSEFRTHWGPMLDKGATTFWEMLPGYDAHWWTRSHCHGWSSGPAYFLSTYQLGVRPLLPGFRKALIAPEPADLRWAEGRAPTPRGDVAVRWRREAHAFHLEFTLPAGMAADVELPALVPEQASFSLTGHAGKFERVNDRWRLEAPPGSHNKVTARWKAGE